MSDFSEFIERNGAFLLSFFGLLGGGVSYILIFCYLYSFPSKFIFNANDKLFYLLN